MFLSILDKGLFDPNGLKDWLQNKGLSVVDYLIKLVLAVIIYFIISKILKMVIAKIQIRLDKRGVDHIASHFILSLLKYAALVFVIVTIIIQLHIVEAASIAALIASAGVGISLAMQGALSNFAGGILLLVIKPFKKGDYIVITDKNVEGVVELIEIYYTTIKTVYGETVKIPNSQLTNNSVLNKSADSLRALVVYTGVSYDTDIEKAKEVLEKLTKDELGDVESSISVFVDELSESSVKLGVFIMVPIDRYLSLKRSINERIIKDFRENGIVIPYNKLDVHLVEGNK